MGSLPLLSVAQTLAVANKPVILGQKEPRVAAPLFEWTETVRPEWIDYNGHMNVAHYVAVFDRASEAFVATVGIDDSYRRAGQSVFAVEQHITYARELKAGAALRCAVRLAGIDDKRLLLFLELHDADAGFLAATCELLCLHVDFVARKAQPFPPAIRDRLAATLAAHGAVPLAQKLGRAIAVPGG
jgi:acyl-CoA thioester hydrolase